jgi:pyruvate dehydrogenase (quinone)
MVRANGKRRMFGSMLHGTMGNGVCTALGLQRCQPGRQVIALEQKTEGMMPTFTDLKNPDFGKVAEAIGLWGRTVTHAEQVKEAVKEWLAVPGPALLNVKVAPMELVIPPFTSVGPAYGMAVFSAKAILHGKAGDVFEMIGENI